MYQIQILNEIQSYYFDYFFNNTFLILFLATLLVDIITGNFVALVQRQWNSSTGLNGTVKHLGIIALVFLLLPIVSFTTEIPALSNGILIYIIIQYTVSITENISSLGFDLDDSFTQYFKFLGKEKDKHMKQDNKQGGGKKE